jgi:hypothetical protein
VQQKAVESLPSAMFVLVRLLLVGENRQADTLQDIQDCDSTVILSLLSMI